MASLLINDDMVTVELSTVEKLEAVHGNVTVPRSAIVNAMVVPDGMAELHGLRMPGTGLPGVIMVGTWRDNETLTFAVCHGRGPAVVIELADQVYDRLVVTVDDPDQIAASLT